MSILVVVVRCLREDPGVKRVNPINRLSVRLNAGAQVQTTVFDAVTIGVVGGRRWSWRLKDKILLKAVYGVNVALCWTPNIMQVHAHKDRPR